MEMDKAILKIALCDDEQGIRTELKVRIQNYFLQRQIECRIEEHENMERLLSELDKGRQFHLLFLDIKMGDGRLNGIEAAHCIMGRHLRSIVVFVCSYDSFISELMEVKAFQFLHKPIQDHQFEHIMELLLKELSRRWYKYTVSYKETIQSFFLKEIYYMESRAHHIFLHQHGGEPIKYLGILDKEQEKLSKNGFLRVHKSYLINMEHILSIDNKSVTLDNSSILPVSRSLRPIIKDIYLQYVGERGA